MKKILVIDDEKDFCYLVKQNLRLTNEYKVVIARGSSMGSWFVSCRWHKPDVILLDIVMPGKDGFELLKMLKNDKETGHIPVIMVTARGDDESRLKATELGCDDYMVKPIDTENLVSRIEKVLSAKKAKKKKGRKK